MENPDPKRRKLEDSPSLQQNQDLQNRSDPYGVPGRLQRRQSVQSPEVLEVGELSTSDQPSPASPQISTIKPQKKVQWETVPREPSPPTQPTALRDISNKAPKPNPKSGKSDTELVVLSSAEGLDSGNDDSDVNPDEDIPARVPAGVMPRRSRRNTGSASASASASASLSESPAPPSTAKKTGTGTFSAAAAAASTRRSSEDGRGADRRGSLGGARVRAVVQV
jgi:hypothetical protein